MLGDFSSLKLASAMARHAMQGHDAIARNIAYSDIPNATALRVPSFADAFQSLGRDQTVAAQDSRQPITVDREMVEMAKNAGRHTAATTIWSESVELFRLSVQSPR